MKKILPIFLALALTACATPLTPEQQADAAERAALAKKIHDNYVPVTYVSIACVAHLDEFVTGYSVQDLVSTRQYGGGSCGGTNAAGYPMPDKWRPGMKVKVRWKLDGKPWRETTTNIMRYNKAGMLFLHIFNNDQVRVVSSAEFYAESPHHPIAPDATVPPPEEQ
ncbi:DUF3304 domain-containing protein [Paraherbaspirillum soli]|uniref:DUF3304 domain-containing protein n=2 Tax=Paraherbaspirillum soli TaxID=631222 RepID=A0ABW0M951_9BURK